MIGGVRLTRTFFVSAAAIIIGGLFILANLPAMATAVWSLRGGGEDSSEVLAQLISEHDRAIATYKARIDGRSVFHKPAKRRPPPSPRRAAPQEPIAPTPPVVRISPTYLGPSLIGIMGDEAWFLPPRAGEGPLRVPLGSTKEGVELLEINADWSIKVRHKKGEYVLNVFQNTPEDIFAPQVSNTTRRVPSLEETTDTAPTPDDTSSQNAGVTALEDLASTVSTAVKQTLPPPAQDAPPGNPGSAGDEEKSENPQADPPQDQDETEPEAQAPKSEADTPGYTS